MFVLPTSRKSTMSPTSLSDDGPKTGNSIQTSRRRRKETLLKAKRQRLRRKYKRHQNRIQSLKESLHKNLCHDLTQKYDHILISKFQVSGMIRRMDRKIRC